MKSFLTIVLLMAGTQLMAQQDSCDVPHFPGGNYKLNDFLKKNIQTDTLMDYGQTGRVYIRFTVDSTGQVRMPAVIKGITPAIDLEVLRVFKLMPDWTPAGCDRPKSTQLVLPVTIRIQ